MAFAGTPVFYNPRKLKADVRAQQRRNPAIVAVHGDSLAGALTVDTSLKQNYGANSPVNWALAQGDGLFRYALANNGNFGVSGERTDQMLARLDAVLAADAGTIILYPGTNDIGQLYPTQATCVQTAVDNVKAMANAFVALGAQVVIDLPIGSTSWDATRIGLLYRYHQQLKEFAEGAQRVYLHDASRMVLDPLAGVAAIAPKTNYFYDATHPNGRGAYYWSKSLLALLRQIIPPQVRLTHLGLTDAQDALFVSNGLFTVQTGGTNNMGAKLTAGAVPAIWVLSGTGNATVALSYGVDDGTALDPSVGGKLIMACTFTAPGETIRLQQDLVSTNMAPGNAFELGGRVRVTSGMDYLSAARMHASVSVDGTSRDWYSLLEGATGQYGPDEAYKVDHVLNPTLAPGNVLNFISLRHFAVARAAGTAVVELARFGSRKRNVA